MNKLFVIGSSNTDMVVQADKLPGPGETVLGNSFLINPGGKGANQAVAAARLGGDVIFLACIGDDLFGRQAVEGFKKEGIDTSFIQTDSAEPSGVALILVDTYGENSIAVASGANNKLSPQHVDLLDKSIGPDDILLIQLEIPIDTVVYAINKAARSGMKIILNPAPAADLPLDCYKHIDVITPNEHEASYLSGVTVTDERSAMAAAAWFHEKGVSQVVITMGKHGAVVSDGEHQQWVPAKAVKPIDTTAAGDTFNGALAVALLEKRNLTEAVTFANHAAAISVTRPGAQSSAPFRKELSPSYY